LLKSRFNRRYALPLALSLVGVVALVTPSSATFPGPDGLISFARFSPKVNGAEIFIARPDGNEVQQLTSNPRRFSFESDWSPDGQLIAFDSDRVDVEGHKRAVQTYVMGADGSGVTQLTRGAGFHGAPGWSPDGGSLAIEADWGDYPALQGIWIVPASDPDGVTQAEAQRVTTIPKGAELDSEPQFSPDGSMIAFTRFKSFEKQKSAIHVVAIDGSGLQRLTPWKLNASHPDWSPDGQMITFDSGDTQLPPAKGDIYVMGADGAARMRLTDNPRVREGKRWRVAQNPVWSPSGTKIMYTLFKARRFDPETFFPPGGPLVMINPDGSGKQVVVDGGNFQNRVDWGTHP
jgi:Tol biopolymer transport system component